MTDPTRLVQWSVNEGKPIIVVAIKQVCSQVTELTTTAAGDWAPSTSSIRRIWTKSTRERKSLSAVISAFTTNASLWNGFKGIYRDSAEMYVRTADLLNVQKPGD
jgi:hypothetical protein